MKRSYLALLILTAPIFAANSNTDEHSSEIVTNEECERSYVEICNTFEWPLTVTISGHSAQQGDTTQRCDLYHTNYEVPASSTFIFSHKWGGPRDRELNVFFANTDEPEQYYLKSYNVNLANMGIVFAGNLGYFHENYTPTLHDQKELLQRRPKVAKALALLHESRIFSCDFRHERSEPSSL